VLSSFYEYPTFEGNTVENPVIAVIKRYLQQHKDQTVRPPHPKGMGYASGRAHARLDGIRNHQVFVCPNLLLRNYCDCAFCYQKSLVINPRKTRKPGQGSLHPRPEGRGIRDPPHSRCNNIRLVHYYEQHPRAGRPSRGIDINSRPAFAPGA